MPRRLGLFLALVACAGCGSEANEARAPEQYSGIVPAEQCGPGSMPRVGSTSCVPVGPGACVDGFRVGSGGWGCEAVLPTGCGATDRAVLGATSCEPVDDCSAAFPPPGAFATATDDASLQAALLQAPAGSTIALDAGEYAGVTLTRDVTLVGRCAKNVVFRGPGLRGIYMQNGLSVSLRSLSVDGFEGGVVASYGPTVALSNVVLSNNTIGLLVGEASASIEKSSIIAAPATTPTTSELSGGIIALLGADVSASEIEIRDDRSGIGAYDPSSRVSVKRSVVSYAGPVETAVLVSAFRGADILIEQSSLQTRVGALLSAGRELGLASPTPPPPAHVKIVGSELRQTGATAKKGLVTVFDEASVEIEESTLHHQSHFAMQVGGATLTVRKTAITSDPTWDVFRSALFVTDGATADLDSVAVISAFQNALLAAHPGSRLTVRASLIHGTEFRGPGPNAELGGSGLAIGAGDDADLLLEQSSVVDSRQFSVYGERHARVQLVETLVDRTLATEAGAFGNGIVVGDTARLAMTGSMLRGSHDAALAVARAAGKIEASVFLDNGVVVHLDGVLLLEQSPKPEPDSGEVLFRDNELFRNQSFVRDGPFALTPVGIE